MLTRSFPQWPLRGRFSFWAVFLVGVALTVTGWQLSRGAYHRQVEAQFHAAAQDRMESVARDFQHGFEDVAVVRNFFHASDEVTRADFDGFLGPFLVKHPYIQAFQWLPEVGPGNRRALEAEARKVYPTFRFFGRDPEGRLTDMPADATFHAVYYVAPHRGNEITLGYCAGAVPARQEALDRALGMGALAASGGIRLLQETEQQTGMLVMIPVQGREGRSLGVVQGVFRLGDLVHHSVAFLEPRGVSMELYDVTIPGQRTLLHEEPSRLPATGPVRNEGLRQDRTFALGGRRWTVEVSPAGGYFVMGTPWGAWIILWGGLAFSALLAGYVRILQVSEAEVRSQVQARSLELAQETESHRRDAQALLESEARFRHLIEVMGEGMWVVDPSGRTTFVNRRMAEMLGYEAPQMVGRSVFDFMAAEDVAQAERNLAERRAGISAQYDFRFRRWDGSELWTIVAGTPVVDEKGQVVSVLGMVTDITERRRQEQAQLQSQKLESLGVLAGGIAHDFNNLLTAILGNISLAQLSLSNASPAWPYLGHMERAVHRATNLTRQMLAYSGKGRFVVGPLDLNHVVEEMSHLLGVSISKKVALRFQLQEGLPVLMAEASQIQQVVMNLVTNASEAIGDVEGVVGVRTGFQICTEEDLARDYPGQPINPGPFVTLEVSDTGLGMAPEVQARMFEPFFTTKFTGRGLGLSAMQGIVRGHKGGIRVYSEVGKGTTIKLIFPAGVGEVEKASAPKDGSGWRGSGTVLVVDDEEGVRAVAADLLRSMGFDVILASDGIEALDRFRESQVPIRAVLMDLTMPRLDGVDTFRALRRLDPGCRVALASGYNEQEAIQDFLGKGLAGFVQKPFLREDLLRAMRKAIEG